MVHKQTCVYLQQLHKAHIKAFSVAWIRQLFEPRQAIWKSIIDHWLPYPRGIIISNIPQSIKNKIMNSIPKLAKVFRVALKHFWSLKITLDPDFFRNKIKWRI